MYIWLVMRWKKVFLLGRLSWSFNSMLKERDDNTKDQNCATFITSFVCLVLCLNSVRQTLSILISKCILLYKCSWLHVPYVHVNIAKVDWLIDWLIGWSFTPYQQYFSHVTTEILLKKIVTFTLYFYVSVNIKSKLIE